jgi:type I restriction enzyme, R subunit
MKTGCFNRLSGRKSGCQKRPDFPCKSNSIAWLAHRLANLHNAGDEAVFDSVIVVTDRRVLDRQLQDTIYQFEHKQGVVEKIDQHSSQLASALEAGKRIIITTLQKFPFVLDRVQSIAGRRFAVIVTRPTAARPASR